MAGEMVATGFVSDYLACQSIDEKISVFLRMLDIESLRGVYRLDGRGVNAPEYPSGEYRFYFDPLDFVGSSAAEEQSAEAFGYNNAPEIIKRRAQLNADGIFPSITSYPEPGSAHLTIMIAFNEKGRRRLGGDGADGGAPAI
ncbi:hypothetical protein LJR009_004694 [Bosea sp. LjRoot9]|uniref:hypothetical protein n=1 Tax=Bosea sp. LjRoot9 TaxID=3342341 RepID=UPI003ECD3B67